MILPDWIRNKNGISGRLLILLVLVTCSEKLLCRGESEPRNSNPPDSWTEWTDWSACSHTCREGVRTRSRSCIRSPENVIRKVHGNVVTKYHCRGKTTEYSVCDLKPCFSDGDDYRETQCAMHDGRTVRGRQVRHWTTNKNASNKCELSCSDPDYGLNYSFGKVENGTPCRQRHNDICINGRCMPVGCDLNVGSLEMVDMCGICGGRNVTCQLIRKSVVPARNLTFEARFYNKQMYDYVAELPVGSRHILARDSSDSFFVLMNAARITRGYALNDDPVIAGASWRYHREPKVDGQTLSTDGPLQSDVHLLIQRRVPIPPIQIEYWINRTAIQNTSTSTTTSRPSSTSPSRHHLFPTSTSQWSNNESHLTTLSPPAKTRFSNVTNDRMPVVQDKAIRLNSIDLNGNHKKSKEPKKHKDLHKPHHKKKGDKCPPCKRGRNIQKQFCQSEFALRVFVVRSEVVGGQRRYDLRVIQSYRNTVPIQYREFLWSAERCRCPKLSSQRDYIVVGAATSAGRGREVRLTVTRDSYVRRFGLERGRKLQQLHREQRRLCGADGSGAFKFGGTHKRNHRRLGS